MITVNRPKRKAKSHLLKAQLRLDLKESQIEPAKISAKKDKGDGAECAPKDQGGQRGHAAKEEGQMLHNSPKVSVMQASSFVVDQYHRTTDFTTEPFKNGE